MVEALGSTAMRALHPASLIFSVGSAARRLLVPGIAVLFFSGGDGYEIVFMLLFIPSVVVALVRHVSYRYRLGDGELVVREGIVTRNERHIPYARIQNIDLVQNVLQRWLRVAVVRVETASGDEPEAVMRVLALADVDAMREAVDRGKRLASAERASAEVAQQVSAAAPAAADYRTVLRLRGRDLFVLGLTSHRGLALVAAALGLLWQSQHGRIDVERARDWVSALRLPDEITAVASLPKPVVALLGLVTAVVLFKALSIGWAFVKFHGFTLRTRGDDLRVEFGLLTRVTVTIPRERIQLVSLSRGPLHRAFGRVAVQVETAGSAGQAGAAGAEKLWIAPIVAEARLHELLAEIQPEVDRNRADWRPIAPAARRRIFIRGCLLALFLITGMSAFAGPLAWLLLPPAVALAGLHAVRWVRSAGWALLDEAVAWRSGWWTRRESIVRLGKIQALARVSSPFDRRRGMASLAVDTAGAGRVGHAVAMRYLQQDVAVELLERLECEAAVRAFRW